MSDSQHGGAGFRQIPTQTFVFALLLLAFLAYSAPRPYGFLLVLTILLGAAALNPNAVSSLILYVQGFGTDPERRL